MFNLRARRIANEDINNHRGETMGIVYDFSVGGKTVYKDLNYEFYVDDKRYGGAIGETQAEDLEKLCKEQNCTNCIGAKFKVEFSKNNPDYSRIIIGNDTILSKTVFL
jgi:hypothetical protein